MSEAKTKVTRNGTTMKFATFDEHEKYRYALGRYWGDRVKKTSDLLGKSILCFIGLNPSTADHEEDDQTITKLTHWTKKWGYDGFVIVNLFGLRSRNPTALYGAKDPQGPLNVEQQLKWMAGATKVIFMWGNHGKLMEQDKVFLKKFPIPAYCFGYTANGSPTHPLMLSYETELREFDPNHVPPSKIGHHPTKSIARPNTQGGFKYQRYKQAKK